MLTKQERDVIRARWGAATGGEWGVTFFSPYDVRIFQAGHVDPFGNEDAPMEIGWLYDKADATFIAAARSDVPALLDTADQLESEVDRLRAAIRVAANSLDNSGDKYGRYAQQILWDALEGVE